MVMFFEERLDPFAQNQTQNQPPSNAAQAMQPPVSQGSSVSPMAELTRQPRRQKIANALMGFGAGMRGEGMEFLKGQQVLSNERKAAAARDLHRARTMLFEDMNQANEQGLTKGSEEYTAFVSRRASDFLANKRRPQIFRLGGQSDETDALTNLVQTDPLAALKNIDEDLSIARAAGIAPSPKVTVEDGMIITQDPYNPTILTTAAIPGSKAGQTTDQKNYEAAYGNLKPGDAGYMSFQEYLKTGKQSINVNTQRGPFDQVMGNRLGAILEQGDGARDQMVYLQRLMDLNVDDQTGSLSSLKANLVNLARHGGDDGIFVGIAERLTGISADDADALMKYNQISNRMLNEVLNIAKGPQTEGDAIRARETIPNIDNPAAVNAFIIDTMYGLAELSLRRRDFILAELQQQKIDGKREDLVAAERKWEDFQNKHPLMAKKANADGTRQLYWRFAKKMRENYANLGPLADGSVRPPLTEENILAAWAKRAN